MREEIHSWQVSRLINDVTVLSKINPKKAMNAIKKYGKKSLNPEDILLIIDNTMLRSAKQGMFLTEEYLYAFSEYSGKYSIKLSETKSLKPEINTVLKVPLVGIRVNQEYFISLPGLNVMITHKADSAPAILLLTVFLASTLSCEIIQEL